MTAMLDLGLDADIPVRGADGRWPEGALVAVQTMQPLGRPLDYRAPAGGVGEGDFVLVPLGPREVLGVVWGDGAGDYDYAKVRTVARVLDAPAMRPEMRRFLRMAGAYTLTPMEAMLRLATRSPGLEDGARTIRVLRAGGPEPARMTPERLKVMDALEGLDGAPVTTRELSEASGASAAVIRGLVKAGTIREEDAPRDAPFPALDPAAPGVALSPEQAAAAEALRAKVRAGGYGTTLLRGVTGSGKTEVYLEMVAECLAAGRQALVLLPEIALTSEFVARVEARFGARPAEWHSGITSAERRRTWRMAGANAAPLVVGARSALFLPFADLGLVVVDEEHDPSYKQEEGVLYHARDMAVLRASITGAQVLLASATPSLESWSNAQAGRYDRLTLTERHGEARLPAMRAIDLRGDALPAGRWISTELATHVAARLERGEQSLLFINRRGYAPVQVCRACGHQIGCDDCDARLVEHRFRKILMCHQCGAERPVPKACPACEAEGALQAVGPGVERLAEEAHALFPQARLAVLSSDLHGGAAALKEEIRAVAEGAADLVIGTQLVAKGHNFPLLTLVGVVDADLGLFGADLRAAERTFALMRQVAGRAGRTGDTGLALLQTHQPNHPVIRAILGGDEEAFWRAEAEERRLVGVPPYGRLAAIVVSSPDAAEAMALGEAMARDDAPIRAAGAEVYGPAPAPIARIRQRHRVRLLVKSPKDVPMQAALAEWIGAFRWPTQVRVAIDVDPQSFL